MQGEFVPYAQRAWGTLPESKRPNNTFASLCLRGVAFSLTALAMCAGGCTGHARLDMVPLNFRDLDPARPLISVFRPNECYYRIDEENRIQVAMRYRNVAVFGPMSRVTVTFSLLLDEPPAGRARTYPLRGESLRGWAQSGPELHRFRSTFGIAVVHDVGKRDLRGRFRTHLRHQTGNVLTGWRGTGVLLILGDFHAVRDDARILELIAESEADDWARSPTAQPAAETTH